MEALPVMETQEQTRARSAVIIAKLKPIYPNAVTALEHSSPLGLLVATILSAQCTDDRVNLVTPALFKRYPTAQDFATAKTAELEQCIHSTGFFRAKARNIILCCKALVKDYHGKVPDTMEELLTLPGVGRKTANVILGSVFGKASGIVVDTHVKRLAERLGLSSQISPEKIEEDLMAIIPKAEWIRFPHLLILHGRSVCGARAPRCPECPIQALCPAAGKVITSGKGTIRLGRVGE
jgi:endonuclease-3